MCTTKVHLAHDLMLGLVHRQRGLQLAVSSSCSPNIRALGRRAVTAPRHSRIHSFSMIGSKTVPYVKSGILDLSCVALRRGAWAVRACKIVFPRLYSPSGAPGGQGAAATPTTTPAFPTNS